MKRILFLGGSASQVGVLVRARQLGHCVILADYLPDAPGRGLAHEFYQVSTTDIPAVLRVAENLALDAVVAYASDPAALTAAVVAEHLGLPGNPVDAVRILTDKGLYRGFLSRAGFNTPEFEGILDIPVVVKPVDSSGSKGVTVVREHNRLDEAKALARSFSRSGKIIIEEFVERRGPQIAGDGFVVDGKLVFSCFADEHFNPDGIVPVGQSFPTTHSSETQQRVHAEAQRLLTLLGFLNGAVNFDAILGADDKVYLMELGPRAGGCLIPEVVQYATGVDEREYVIRAALGEDCSSLSMRPVGGHWASYMVHSGTDGVYSGLDYPYKPLGEEVEVLKLVRTGEPVKRYEHSGCAVAMQIVEFPGADEMAGFFSDSAARVGVVLA